MAGREGVVTKGDDLGEDFSGSREPIVGSRKGRLHDQRVRGGRRAGLDGGRRAQFEIAGVEQAPPVGVFDERLGRTQHMAGGNQSERAGGR